MKEERRKIRKEEVKEKKNEGTVKGAERGGGKR